MSVPMAADDQAFKAHLTSLEEQTWQALCSSGSALLPFLAEHCTMLFPGGMMLAVNTTPSLADVLRSPEFQPWSEYSLHAVRVIKLGDGAGVICYRVKALRSLPPTPSGGAGGDGESDEGGRGASDQGGDGASDEGGAATNDEEGRGEGHRQGSKDQSQQQGRASPTEPPTATTKKKKKGMTYEALVSSTWLRVATGSSDGDGNSHGKDWKMVTHQQTPVA